MHHFNQYIYLNDIIYSKFPLANTKPNKQLQQH